MSNPVSKLLIDNQEFEIKDSTARKSVDSVNTNITQIKNDITTLNEKIKVSYTLAEEKLSFNLPLESEG